MKRFEIIRKSVAIVLAMIMLLIPFGGFSVNATTPGNCTLTKADGSSVEYATLKEAIKAANSATGDTVTITVNNSHTTAYCTESDAYTGSANLVINGNGNTLTTDARNGYHYGSLMVVNTAASVTIKSLIVNDSATTGQGSSGIIRILRGDLVISDSYMTVNAPNFPVIEIQSKYDGLTVTINRSVLISTANETIGGMIKTAHGDATATAGYTINANDSKFILSGAGTVQNCFMFTNLSDVFDVTVNFIGCSFLSLSARTMINYGKGNITSKIENCNFVMPLFSTHNKVYTALYLQGAVKSLTVLNTTFQGTSCIRSSAGQDLLGDWSSNIGIRDNWARLVKSATVTGTNAIQCDASQYSVSTLPEMQDGAAVRLNKDTSGIRFTTTVTKANDANFKVMAGEGGSVTYGTIFALKSELEVSNVWADNRKSDLKYSFVTHDFLNVMDIPYVDIEANQGVETDAQGNITYRAALKGIASANYADNICAFAYVKVTYGDGSFDYFYSAFDHTENTRSIQYIAQEALADTTQTYTEAELKVLNMYAGTQS